jgi:hypothetical protein
MIVKTKQLVWSVSVHHEYFVIVQTTGDASALWTPCNTEDFTRLMEHTLVANKLL